MNRYHPSAWNSPPPQPEPAPASFSRRVQSVFDRSSSSRDDDKAASGRENSKGFSSCIFPSIAATKSVSALTCVRDSDGKRNLDTVIQHVIDGNISMFELSAALFPSDEDDTDGHDVHVESDSDTCLCNLATLIQNGYVGIGDINVLKVRQRAIFEARNPNTHACKCGELVAVQNTIESVLNTGRSHARDKFLEAFLCSLLKTSQLSSSVAANSLLLVKPAVNAVRTILSARESNHLIGKWAHVAVFQKNTGNSRPVAGNFDNANNDGDDEVREYWTPELRDLAIGQNAALHLMNKTTEENALLVLFAAMSEPSVISLVSQVLTTICNTSYQANSGNSLSDIEFARFCTLLKFAGTLRNDDDDDANSNSAAKILETSLISALCSFQAAACKQNQAMIITLARFFFIGKEDTVNERYVRYEKWFLRALKSASKPCVKILLEILSDLMPLDPLPYLKATARCFRRVPAWVQLSRDYNMLARTRIKDLEPNDATTHQNRTAQKAAQSMEDLCKYVAQFHRNHNSKGDKDTVPKALVRFMNFHRYSFRENILPLLIAPDAQPPQEIIDREFALGGIELFDRRRIELIKILAYKRMDKAIRKDEADKCIPKIEENIKARKDALPNHPAEGPTRLKTPKNISEDSSVAEIFQELCNCAKEMENDVHRQKKDLTEVVDVDEPEKVKKMAYRGIERWKKADELLEKKLLEEEENLPERAAVLLQLITDQVRISAAELGESGVSTGNGNANGNNVLANGHSMQSANYTHFDSDKKQYRMMWDGCAGWMCPLLVKVLSRRKLMAVWHNLKFFAIANISFQSHTLSATQIFAIALLIFATVNCSDESVQLGLPFLHKKRNGSMENCELLHVLDAIQSNLPVDNVQNVSHSLQFATHYLMLVLCNSVNPVLKDAFELPMKGPDGTYYWNTQDVTVIREHKQSEVVPQQLINLVRWVCSQPWRMKYNRDVIFINKDIPSFEVIKLLRRSLGIIERLKVLQCGKFGLEDWIPLEIRAGWGRHEKIPAVLAKFAVAENKSLALIVREIATTILKVRGGYETAAIGSFPSRILLGVSDYARACQHQCGLQAAKESRSSTSMSFARCINDIFRSDSETHLAVGYMLVKVGLRVPSPFYFLGDTAGDIFMHIHLSISPRFWPFTVLHLDFLLDAMIASNAAVTQAKGRSTTIQSTPALVASIAYHSAVAGGKEQCTFRAKIQALHAPQWSTFRKDVQQFSSITRKIVTRGTCGQGDDHMLALGTQVLATQYTTQTQGNGRKRKMKSKEYRLAVQCHPEIVALALLQSVQEGNSNNNSIAAEARAIIEWLVAAVGELLVADVLDVAIEIAAQFPFVRPEEDEILLWSNAALAEFIACRIQLCKSAQVPYWLSGSGMVCDPRRIPGCVANTRRLVGVVEECPAPVEANARPSPLKKVRHGECGTKVHLLWHARIAGAFAKLDDSCLEEALGLKNNNNNSGCEEEGMLPMLARVLQDLHRVDLDAVMNALAMLKNNSHIGLQFVKSILSNQATGILATLERISQMPMDAPVHADVISKVRNTAPSVAAMLARSRRSAYHIHH